MSDEDLVNYLEEHPDDVSEVLSREIVHRRLFMGPLPSPDVLREYNEVVPGLAG
jgi:uncharacterized membrane protein